MKWIKNKIIIGFGIFFSVFFSVFVSSSSYAISDVSVTVQNNITQTDVFPDCTDSCLDQYSYLKVTYTGWTGYSSYPFWIIADGAHRFTYNIGFVNNGLGSPFPVTEIYSLPFNGTSGNSFKFGAGGISFNVPVTFTLTNSLDDSSSDCPDSPSGLIQISENGTYDVSSYAEASVNVPIEVIQGDYHDDLISIKVGIYVCAGTLLVLYFFYCIYRIIIRNSGVK